MDDIKTDIKTGSEAISTPEPTVTNAEVETPTTKEVPKAEAEEKVEETATVESETRPEAEVEEGKKTAQHRIKELDAANKAKEEKIKSLEDKMAEFTGSVEPQDQYIPQPQAGQEISPEQYQQDVARSADAIVNFRLQQERVLNRINSEASESVRTHPELDPKSDKFDKDLSESVTTATLAYARVNPTKSVKEFVDSLMKPYRKAVDRQDGEAQEKIAKQVSEAALKPTQVRTVEKEARDMSVEELEKKLGVIVS
jgi:hypothetical protein